MRKVFGVVRILVAGTGIVALAGDFNYSLGSNPLAIANFFSYFTVQSAIIAVAVFAIGAIYALREKVDPLWLDMVRVLATAWVIVSGIVFAFILVEGSLRGVPVWAPWSSQLMHFWIPAYAVIDWLVAPGRKVPWKTTGFVLIFPVLWVAFTMVRGSFVYWYPYFFLDPALVEIPFEFALYLIIIVGIFCAVAALLIAISHLPRIEHLRARLARERMPLSRSGRFLPRPRPGR